MKKITAIILPILLALIALTILEVALILAQTGNIDEADKYAWSTNAGWINFNPAYGGVIVYDDHLEGYAWGENIGWVRLGSYDGGSPHTYANTTETDYGVNNDGIGNLSGYAWGTSIGWINFNPTNGGVTIDPVTGDFDGYAWSENIGWISFQNTSLAYKVNTSWRGSRLDVKIYVNLQGDNRPSPEGWQIPMSIGFYGPGSDVMSATPVYSFTASASVEWIDGGTKATVTVGPVNPGTYDITVDSSTALLNVKRGVGIW